MIADDLPSRAPDRSVSRRCRDERGSVSLFAVAMTIGALLLLGLIVDGGARIQAIQRADGVAREAARQGGQALQAGPAVRGQAVLGDTAAGAAAARRYLAAAGVNGSVSVRGATISVDTRLSYTPIILSMIGPLRVSGHAETRIVRVFEGNER